MRVVHVATGGIPVPPAGAASVEEDIFRLAGCLNRLGCRAEIIDIRADIPRRRGSGITFHEVCNPPLPDKGILFHLKTLAFGLLAALKLWRLAGRRQVDVIHTHAQSSAFFILLTAKTLRWKAPVIYHCHNPYVLMKGSLTARLRNSFEPVVCRKADVVIAQTRTAAQALIERFKVSPSRLVVIPSGPDMEEIGRFVRGRPLTGSADTSEKIVFYPSRVCARKNQLGLVRAMPRILQSCPEARLVFAGPVRDRIEDPAYFDSIEEFIDRESLRRFVEFAGEVSREALYEMYCRATVCVFPTLAETIGQVQLEAMAFGVPCIVSNIPTLRDVIDLLPGSAVMVDPADPGEIAGAVIELLQSEQRRSEIAARGRQLIATRFNTRQTAVQLLELYEKVARA